MIRIHMSGKTDEGELFGFSVEGDEPVVVKDDLKQTVYELVGEEKGNALLHRLVDSLAGLLAAETVREHTGSGTKSTSSGGSRRSSSSGSNPGRPDGPAPECAHGEKVWKNPDDKPWKGWFCPQNKRNGSCKTEWVNDD